MKLVLVKLFGDSDFLNNFFYFVSFILACFLFYNAMKMWLDTLESELLHTKNEIVQCLKYRNYKILNQEKNNRNEELLEQAEKKKEYLEKRVLILKGFLLRQN